MNEPLVSICIPTYNGAQFIEEAMSSAIAQTYSNLEIVVSDDASKDNTIAIIETFRQKTKIPICIYNHQPNGIGANWNYSVKKAKGEYIKFLFQDDILLPSCIEKMILLAESNKNVGLVYCKRKILYNSEVLFDVKWVSKFKNLHIHWDGLPVKTGAILGKKYLKDKNLLNYPLNKIGEPPAVLIHKSVFKKIGYFSIKLKQELDFEFWYRLMPFYNIGFVDEELIMFRLHSSQATQVNNKLSSKDSSLLPIILFKNIFIYLHYYQKKRLLIKIIKHTKIYKTYVKLRLRMNI